MNYISTLSCFLFVLRFEIYCIALICSLFNWRDFDVSFHYCVTISIQQMLEIFSTCFSVVVFLGKRYYTCCSFGGLLLVTTQSHAWYWNFRLSHSKQNFLFHYSFRYFTFFRSFAYSVQSHIWLALYSRSIIGAVTANCHMTSHALIHMFHCVIASNQFTTQYFSRIINDCLFVLLVRLFYVRIKGKTSQTKYGKQLTTASPCLPRSILFFLLKYKL